MFEVFENKDGPEIEKLDFSNKGIWLQLKVVTSGFAGETSTATITQQDEATSEEIYIFRKECRMSLATMIRKILERSLFGLLILQCMSVFM